MLFNSISFAIFLPVIFVLYWFINNRSLRLQNILLLAASYFFYACWDWRFLFLLVFSTLLDYFTGIKMTDSENARVKKFWFFVSIIVNLSFLGFFKYYNFFTGSFSEFISNFGIHINTYTLQIVLPVGISFYTFHGLSYVIDIYRGRIKAEKNFIDYSVFVCFFPLLVAGPIERATHLLPQVKTKREFSQSMFNSGLIQIAVGLFRKIVIADTLAVYVDTIYKNPGIYNSSSLVLATVFYAFQIYFDFAGYSDIAIGTAKLFGFDLLKNFNFPYFSKSITEFWRKWHMSLSSWLRDYLYIEFGGNKSGILKTYRNLMLTMLIGGLWHGSNWTFIIWGGIHGMALSIEKFVKSGPFFKFLQKFNSLGYLYTFTIVGFAWIFFRAANVKSALTVISGILKCSFSAPFINDINLLINSAFVLLTGLVFDWYLFKRKIQLEHLGERLSFIKIIFFIVIAILLITLFYSNSNNFIYFQF